MFINGLATAVHSSADNIVARAVQYLVDTGGSQRNNKSHYFHQLRSKFFLRTPELMSGGRIWKGAGIGHATGNVFLGDFEGWGVFVFHWVEEISMWTTGAKQQLACLLWTGRLDWSSSHRHSASLTLLNPLIPLPTSPRCEPLQVRAPGINAFLCSSQTSLNFHCANNAA